MKTLMTGWMLCLGLVLSSGCLLVEKSDDFDKPDARREAKRGSDVDYCDLYGWYGDGTCDDFCAETDPDCFSWCDAPPSCGSRQIQVQSCDGITDCEEVEGCAESTIFCAGEVVNCLAFPACEPGYDIVEQCAADAECYEETLCGTTISCQRAIDQCMAIPICPPGTLENPDCPAIDIECLEVSECGLTIFCEYEALCDAFPVCPDGSREIDSCDNTMSPCDEYSLCGSTISCENWETNCDAEPVCQEGYVEIGSSCPTDADCYEETVCGTTIACLQDGVLCQAVPGCPDGYTQTTACPQDASCISVTLCGQTIMCTDA